VNLIVTLRKFLSLLLSVIYFDNNFTAFHWLGTFLVFTGTLLFTNVLSLCYGHHSSDAVVSEQIDHSQYTSVNGQPAVAELPASTMSRTDTVVRKRIIDHKFADQKYLEDGLCSGSENSVAVKSINPQPVTVITGNETDDLQKNVSQSVVVTKTVLARDIFLDAAKGSNELSGTACDDAVSDEHFKSL